MANNKLNNAKLWWDSMNYSEKLKYKNDLSRYSSIDSPVDSLLFPDEDILIELWEKEIK